MNFLRDAAFKIKESDPLIRVYKLWGADFVNQGKAENKTPALGVPGLKRAISH